MKTILFATVLLSMLLTSACGEDKPKVAQVQADPQKLSALETAYKAGVLTKDEFEAKKQELIAQAPPAGARVPVAIAGWNKETNARGFDIEHPAGWTVEASGKMQIVARSQDGGSLVEVAPFVSGRGTCQQYLAQAVVQCRQQDARGIVSVHRLKQDQVDLPRLILGRVRLDRLRARS